jgi:Protein of unknown function (DUF2884)
MTYRHLPWLVAAAVALTACGNHGDDTQVFGGSTDIVNHRITLHDGLVTIKASGVPDAVIEANGQLTIDGKAVPVNDAQRALLQRYNATAQTMRADAIATGKAGMATATQAMSTAAGKLTGAESEESAKDKVEAAAQTVKQAAGKICSDLADMKVVQDQLATQMDAFKPYATALETENIERCQEHTAH